ncbi:MAG: extracellular solute-binding protein, partial [Candidatus Dormibacteraceae bacterium]
MIRRALALPVVAALALAGCSGGAAGSAPVQVIYAGSLTRLMENHLLPGFRRSCGCGVQGEPKGSLAIANLIKGGIRRPDVFISADVAADRALAGPANGNHVSWWIDFATTELVIGWSPKSRFASDFRSARLGRRSWESVLEQPGLRLGRTDPELDPKGYRTLWLFQLDERRSGRAGEARRILGPARNPAQIFPEEELVARLQAGELDAGVFYLVEAVAAGLPYLRLPAAVNQGDPTMAAAYGSVAFTTANGVTVRGSPILFTVTIPASAPDRPGALSWVRYLLGRQAAGSLAGGGLAS